jgi:methanogenic corrinoid protein MtbC1
VGGRPVTQEFAQETGADAYGENGPEAVTKALELVGTA